MRDEYDFSNGVRGKYTRIAQLVCTEHSLYKGEVMRFESHSAYQFGDMMDSVSAIGLGLMLLGLTIGLIGHIDEFFND